MDKNAEERLKKYQAIIDTQKEREDLEDLILQNQTMDALIKGLTGDIEIFKNDKEHVWTPADIVRFTMQLNVMKSKKARNLEAINAIIAKNKEASKK